MNKRKEKYIQCPYCEKIFPIELKGGQNKMKKLCDNCKMNYVDSKERDVCKECIEKVLEKNKNIK